MPRALAAREVITATWLKDLGAVCPDAAKAGLHDARVVALVVVLEWLLAAAIALRWREARTPMRAGRGQRA